MHSLENQFHGAANAASLRELYRKGDFTGLLEYALLLAEQEASQRSQISWLMREVITAPTGAIESWHLAAAQELLDQAGA